MEEEFKHSEKDYLLPASIVISTIILAGAWVYTAGVKNFPDRRGADMTEETNQALGLGDQAEAEGIVLPLRWGNLGVQMVAAGVIDEKKLEALYSERSGLNKEDKKLIQSTTNDKLVLTQENAAFLLNLFWALGLSNKNDILEKGEMSDPQYGGAGNFASTGGWTLAQGNAMTHFSSHSFLRLTPEQQALVERVSQNIYRSCCDNPTHFPDCNHGMAMLGLLELMAAQGATEEEMYKVALQVNSYWFPDTYLAIGKYLESKGVAPEGVSPKEILGINYSSASGYRKILSQINTPTKQGGGGCSV